MWWFKRKNKQVEQPYKIPEQETKTVQNPIPIGNPYVCGNFEISPTEGGWSITKYFGFSDESSITIPAELDGKKIVAIGPSAFENCSGLNSVRIEDGITKTFGRASALNSPPAIFQKHSKVLGTLPLGIRDL